MEIPIIDKRENMSPAIRYVIEFFMLFVGAVIAAFALEEFLVPNTILDGGIVGVSMIVNTLSGIRLGLLTLVLNLPFVIVGYRKIGKSFLIKTGFSMAVFSVFLEIFAEFTNATDEYLLAVCFGGVILGVGVGLVIRYGGCLDGTETVAILLNRKYGISVGRVVLLFNVVIYATAGFLFGFDRAMYSLLTYFITSKILDYIENGTGGAKAVMIITDEGDLIADEIYKQLGRTVSRWQGEGLISGEKQVLYCVITKLEIYDLRRLISEVDASAFITISDVSEIIGTHIKKKGDLNDRSFVLRRLSVNEVRSVYTHYMPDDFAANEIKPLAAIERMMQKGKYEAYGFYENGELRAYLLLVTPQEGSAYLLDYFAVLKDDRGKSYGSEALHALMDFLPPDITVFIESENPYYATSEDERTTMEKRKRFYEANGAVSTGVTARVFDAHYKVYALSGKEAREHDAWDTQTYREAYDAIYRHNMLTPKLYSENVFYETEKPEDER